MTPHRPGSRLGRAAQAALVGVIGAFVAAACSPPASVPSPSPQASPSAPASSPSEAPAASSKPTGAPDSIKIGIVTFLSGAAAPPFGVPARNAADVLVNAINAGEAPAPYATPGIGGVPIKTVTIDEAGGADKQVAELRRLVLNEKVDLVIGYISSGDCGAVAPVVEELKALTVMFDCGTQKIFEEADHHYLFRTAGHQIIDNVGAARYVLKRLPNLKRIAGINQNYAWGQDSWNTFKASLEQLDPSVEVVAELFPELLKGEYSAEISSLLSKDEDVIHSSFWGGDLEALIVQGAPRGLAEHGTLVLTTADTLLPTLGDKVPEGVIVGARGPHGALAPKSAFNDWFRELYRSAYAVRPVYPSYHMAQAIFGVKAAYEKAIQDANGAWPSTEQVIKAFEGLSFETPSGTISMALGKGHQAVEPVAFGTTGPMDSATGERTLVDVVEYPVSCVNPPEGVKSLDWIAGGFAGASGCP